MCNFHVEADIVLLTPKPIQTYLLVGYSVLFKRLQHLFENRLRVSWTCAIQIKGTLANFHPWDTATLQIVVRTDFEVQIFVRVVVIDRALQQGPMIWTLCLIAPHNTIGMHKVLYLGRGFHVLWLLFGVLSHHLPIYLRCSSGSYKLAWWHAFGSIDTMTIVMMGNCLMCSSSPWVAWTLCRLMMSVCGVSLFELDRCSWCVRIVSVGVVEERLSHNACVLKVVTLIHCIRNFGYFLSMV